MAPETIFIEYFCVSIILITISNSTILDEVNYEKQLVLSSGNHTEKKHDRISYRHSWYPFNKVGMLRIPDRPTRQPNLDLILNYRHEFLDYSKKNARDKRR